LLLETAIDRTKLARTGAQLARTLIVRRIMRARLTPAESRYIEAVKREVAWLDLERDAQAKLLSTVARDNGVPDDAAVSALRKEYALDLADVWPG
jgi:hypothetical protein